MAITKVYKVMGGRHSARMDFMSVVHMKRAQADAWVESFHNEGNTATILVIAQRREDFRGWGSRRAENYLKGLEPMSPGDFRRQNNLSRAIVNLDLA